MSIRKAKPRKIAFVKAGRKGGKATKARHPDQFSEMGKIGGATTKARHPDQYSAMGKHANHRQAAEKLLRKNPGFYQEIGRKGGMVRPSQARGE